MCNIPCQGRVTPGEKVPFTARCRAPQRGIFISLVVYFRHVRRTFLHLVADDSRRRLRSHVSRLVAPQWHNGATSSATLSASSIKRQVLIARCVVAALFGFGVTQSNGNNDEGCTAGFFSWQEGNLPDPSISEATLGPLDWCCSLRSRVQGVDVGADKR